ncbi:MAG: hypothetical protein LBT76_03910, partial [Tannerella sp.]|nr:hypothetical protein [Tannerella sp.]
LERFGIASGTEEALEAKIEDYLAACAGANRANAGSIDRLARRERAAEATAAVRAFVNRYLRYNEAVTDGDRLSLGLHIRDTKLTPAPVPATCPVAIITLPGIRQLSVAFRDEGAYSRGKPLNVTGCEIRYAILDNWPESVDELIHSAFFTHSPCIFTFDENRRGKTVYFCLRWENARGEKGPWSGIQMAIIP